MSGFTLSLRKVFPEGTSVAAYDATGFDVYPGVNTLGSAIDTKTITGGVAGFVNLVAGRRYYAVGTVNAIEKHVAFTADAAASLEIVSAALGSPALGTTTAVHAAVTDNGSPRVVTTAITNPPTPRNVTATAGGTNTDIKAISVTVKGTNAEGDPITEVLPAFTVDTAGTVVGSKAFVTVTEIDIPAHDGTGATTAVGLGAKLGLGSKLTRDSVLNAYLAGVREGTRPTVVIDNDEVEKNLVTLNSALNGSAVIVDYYET